MSTLTADVSDTERDWHISEPLADGLVYLQADDEFVKVIFESLDGLTIYVMRGVVDTVPASHLSGAALTAANAFSGGGGGVTVEVPPDAPVAVTNIVAAGAVVVGDEATLAAGAAQTVSLVGPATVNFDDANVGADLVDLGLSLPDGTLVIRAFCLMPVGWVDDQAGPPIDVKISIGPDAINAVNFLRYGGGISTLAFTVYEPPATTSIPINVVASADYAAWAVITGGPVTDMRLYFEIYTNNDHFVQGVANIYALIATPAA